jgi:hypothetical protein
MNGTTLAMLAILGSLILSAVLVMTILPPTRALLGRLCPTEPAVAFWARFSVLMLFLGPLIVTLLFGLPAAEAAQGNAATALVRIVCASLIGGFLTVGGIGVRIGTLRVAMRP